MRRRQATSHKLQVASCRIMKVILLCALQCGGVFFSKAMAQEKIIAVVNNEIITQKDLSDFMHFMRLQMQKENNEESQNKIETMKNDLLEKLIEDRLILQEAKKSTIKIDESRVEARIQEIKRRYPGEEEFRDDLARQGLVRADLENKIREQFFMFGIIQEEIRNKIRVTPEEVTAFYNANPKEFISPELRKVKTIAFEDEALAAATFESLKNGEKLEELAKSGSLTVDELQVSQTGQLKKEVEDAVFALGEEKICAPTKINDKYYIFVLEEIIPSRQETLSETQDKIHAFLFQSKMQVRLSEWVEKLRKQSYIKVM